MITALEAKHGVKIKRVFPPDAPPHGCVYGIYKGGYGLYTFITRAEFTDEHHYIKRVLEYAIMCLQMKLNEIKRNKIKEQQYKIGDIIV